MSSQAVYDTGHNVVTRKLANYTEVKLTMPAYSTFQLICSTILVFTELLLPVFGQTGSDEGK